MVAGAVIDNYSTEEPSGVIRGFDTETGELVWAWDSRSADENALPSPTHTYTNNSPKSWITASFDPKLNLVYLPMGVHTPDIWGGDRDELVERYASALGLLGRDRPEGYEDRVDAPERHDPGRGAVAGPDQDGRAEPWRSADHGRRSGVSDLHAGLLHSRL